MSIKLIATFMSVSFMRLHLFILGRRKKTVDVQFQNLCGNLNVRAV